MEKLMQYVWQHRLWPALEMQTVDGRRIHVVDPGRLNTDAGPDFFNAKVRIAGRLWAGDVEIHVRASDWHRHHHDGDPAYDSVILHVVDRDDAAIKRSNGEVIPQMLMPCSPTFGNDYRDMLDRAVTDLPCADVLAGMSSLHIHDWLSALTLERLHAKSDHFEDLRRLSDGSHEEAAYILLARCLGFGVNAEPFERLARSLPLKFIGRHRDNLLAVEALLMGQSGLLDSIPAGSDTAADPYVDALAKEYRFMAAKFSLSPLQSAGWKMGRMRPANFPHRRIAYLARLLHTGATGLWSTLAEATDINSVREFFDVELTDYWRTHYHLSDAPHDAGNPRMSRATIDLLLINVAAPLIFNRGIATGDDRLTQRALAILASIAPERNSVVELFARNGVKPDDASMSQALVHLRRNYCEQRKCLYCRFGHRLLSSRTPRAAASTPTLF